LIARDGAVEAAVLAFGAIIAKDEIFVLAECKSLISAGRGDGLGAGFQVRFDQTAPIHQKLAVADLDGFARQSDEALHGEVIRATVADDDEVAALGRSVEVAKAIEEAAIAVVQRGRHAAALDDDGGKKPAIDGGVADQGTDEQDCQDQKLAFECATPGIGAVGDVRLNGNRCGGSSFPLLPALGVVFFGWQMHWQNWLQEEHRAKVDS
jgi:hypothetical protein